MQFRKGDKVRFLNEKGEGVVTRIVGGGQVMVEVEDGFEFPFPVNQLVPAQPSVSAKSNAPAVDVKKSAPPETSSIPETPASNRMPDGIYFAGIPQNQNFPSAGKIETVLFNHSDYDLYYTISLRNGSQYDCIQAGALGPRRQASLESLTPQELDQWNTLKIDLLFFSEETYEHRAPVSEIIRFKGVKFFKDSSYTDNLLTGKKAWIYEVNPLEPETQRSQEPLTAAQIRQMLVEKEKNTQPQKSSTPALKNQMLEQEIDLHIEELLDNWNGMSNAQLLDVQLKRVEQAMDEAFAQHLRSIVLIHGVGNGRLKTEVRKLLASYKGIRFHDASFQRYGFGATQVEFLR